MPQQKVERKCSNFLEAFELYSRDNFTPEIFSTWVGISVIAGALERKVWLPWSHTLSYYPNMFILLVSPPGQGKSTALNKGIGLLQDLRKESRISFLPSQVTEAKMIELMSRKAYYLYDGVKHEHNSGYYFASEASDSLKEIYGDITSSMTNLYDCPDFWQKATKKDGMLTLTNACLNLLAGSTFDYLGKLITDSNIMGGFASRITYVISREEKIRESKFAHTPTQLERDVIALSRANLAHDLSEINNMVGPFRAEPEFAKAWEEWDTRHQEHRRQMTSEKMKSLLVRQGTSLHKLTMIFSAAESSDMILKVRHLEKAARLLSETQETLPGIFREARAQNTQTPDGLKNAIISVLEKQGNMERGKLCKQLMLNGFDPKKANDTISAYLSSQILGLSPDGELELLINANDNL